MGVKPYSTETEDAFLTSLNHALDNIAVRHRQCIVHKEVALSQVFREDISHHDLFYTGRFDFVVFDKRTKNPLFAIELDGKEHHDDETVKARDRQKEEICRQHSFQLIHVENSYASRYAYIKTILTKYFSKMFLVGRCAQIAMAASDQIYYVGRQTGVEILAIRSAQCYNSSDHWFDGKFVFDK